MKNVASEASAPPGFEIKICSFPKQIAITHKKGGLSTFSQVMVRRSICVRLWRKIRIWLPLQGASNI